MLAAVIYHRNMKKLIILLSAFWLFTSSLAACSLAMHEWELVFDQRISLPGPIIPAQEFPILATRFVPSELSKILWVDSSGPSTAIVQSFKNTSKKWTTGLDFVVTDQQGLATQQISSTTIIVEPVAYSLRIAMFKDKLSDYRCRQLVIMQEGRIKLAMPHAKPPVAEQHYTRAWLSFYFFDMPVPGRILSIEAFPVSEHLSEAYIDMNLAEGLLRQGLIQRRPDNYVSPYPDGFPQLEQ